VDLLDDNLCKTRDQKKAHRGNARQDAEGYASTMLLDGLYASQQGLILGIY
jgi:hypothetical protein